MFIIKDHPLSMLRFIKKIEEFLRACGGKNLISCVVFLLVAEIITFSIFFQVLMFLILYWLLISLSHLFFCVQELIFSGSGAISETSLCIFVSVTGENFETLCPNDIFNFGS